MRSTIILVLLAGLVAICNTETTEKKSFDMIKSLNEGFMGFLRPNLKEQACTKDSQCDDRYHCDTVHEYCTRDSLFPMEPMDYAGIIILALLMSLATSAGLGGGEIIVPVITIVFLFEQEDAAPLSQCCIMWAGITRFAINYTKKHPYKEAVPIDYRAAMILMPAIILGSSIGMMLHKFLPTVIQQVMMLVILVYCVYESATKGLKFWRQETEEKKRKEKESLEPLFAASPGDFEKESPEKQQFLKRDVNSDQYEDDSYLDRKSIGEINYSSNGGSNSTAFNKTTTDDTQKEIGEYESSSSTPSDAKKRAAIAKIQEGEKTHWQWGRLAPIWACFVANIFQAFIRDSGVFDVPVCGAVYWIVYIAYVLFCVAVVTYSVWAVGKDSAHREEIGFPACRGDVDLTLRKLLIVAGCSIASGAIATVIGIGGGVLYIPILLIMGYPPFVASSTSMFMVMYSATGNYINFSIAGHVFQAWAYWLALWTVLGVILGVTVSNRIVQKTGRQSLFIIMLGGLLILMIGLSLTFGIIDVVNDIHDGNNVFASGSLCS